MLILKDVESYIRKDNRYKPIPQNVNTNIGWFPKERNKISPLTEEKADKEIRFW